jgi:hypothetical protein
MRRVRRLGRLRLRRLRLGLGLGRLLLVVGRLRPLLGWNALRFSSTDAWRRAEVRLDSTRLLARSAREEQPTGRQTYRETLASETRARELDGAAAKVRVLTS